jgi:CheY-like chemotaxis protein
LARKVRQVLDDRGDKVEGASRIRTVLLCEDEPLIQMVMVEMLKDLGIEAVEAGTAREALDALNADIDMLISDVRLPDGSGIDLAGKVREQYPDMPIIFATGHHMKPPLENSAVLGKPFSEDDLARALGLKA